MAWNTTRGGTANSARNVLLFAAALTAIPAINLQAQTAARPAPTASAPAASASSQPAKPDPPPNGYAKIIPLYPGIPPDAKGSAPTDIPKLYYYPATGTISHTAVLVLPGGGYNHLVNEKEGGVEARWLASRGVAAFVLQYRIAPYRFPVPMNDGMRAIRYVRSHAAEFAIEPNKIGIWGFSAGGHLAGYLSTAPDGPAPSRRSNSDPTDQASAHPNFAILSYARLSLDSSIPRTGNMEPLLGDNPTSDLLNQASPILHVTSSTSPAFIYSTTGDQTVNSLNATAYYDALKKAGVPAELHIFELGPHGTGMGQNLAGLSELNIWPVLLEHWMQQNQWMPVSASNEESVR